MSEVSLFEHNEKAYKKLKEALKTSKCTTINHATGTGKSFIALKYLYENRDKKYLYIAPTYPIIDQLLESCYKIGIKPKDINIDTMIYRNLLRKDMERIYEKYDGFILDEYHRTGAKETYKKIKQLKLMLKERDDEKKLIGLTATPIRYLDQERNMTEEIFDGNVASSLPLSEAMLEELLPVPTYINSKIACRPTYESTLARVKKMYPTKEKEKLQKKLEKINGKINNGITDNKQLVNKHIKQKDGKYIIFCNTIEELEQYYHEIDKWFEDLGPIKKYKVHSRIEIEPEERGEIKNIKAKNKKTLASFNKDNKGISVLLCVDILNEGVHVEDIDGIFMLRKTTSPIIYFQQVGRALSFSGRKKQIKIFDLVNNFNNHMAIDMVYEEFHKEFEKKIQEHPENKEKYEETLQRFKIMDETKSILKDLSDIKEQVTEEKIIESKIDYSIEVLEQFINSGKSNSEIFTNDATKKAYMQIASYNTFVNNNQFEKLLKIHIILPESLSMTIEERQELLHGYNSVQEKLKAEYSNCITDVIEFIKNNNRLPTMTSEDIKEKNLARRYLYGLTDINENHKEELKNICETQEIQINPWEKIIFGEKLTTNDLNQIIELSQNYINNKKEIPEYLVSTIEKVIRRYDIKENTLLFNLLEESQKIKQEREEKIQKIRYELLSKIDKYLQIHIDDSPEQLKEAGIIDIVKKLKPRDIKYIQLKYRSLKNAKYKTLLETIGDDPINTFCKKMKHIEEEDFDIYYQNIKQNNEVNEFIIELVEFITTNNGKYPSIESEDEKEKSLAEQFIKYSKDEKQGKRFKLLEQDKNSELYSPFDIIYESAIEKKEHSETKIAILKSIQFLKKNGRRPFSSSDDPVESQIATEYEEKCLNKLGNSEISILNSMFNNRKNFRKTYEAYLKNIRRREGKEPSD